MTTQQRRIAKLEGQVENLTDLCNRLSEALSQQDKVMHTEINLCRKLIDKNFNDMSQFGESHGKLRQQLDDPNVGLYRHDDIRGKDALIEQRSEALIDAKARIRELERTILVQAERMAK